MGNVGRPPALTVCILMFSSRSWRRQERPLVRCLFHIFVLITYGVRQFRGHRRDRDYAGIWGRIARNVLL